MNIKRLFLLLTLVVSLSVLAACKPDETIDPIQFEITATANIEDVTILKSETVNNDNKTEYELTAPTVDGYDFLYWIDADSEDIISLNVIYVFVATKDQSIEAIYEGEGITISTSANIDDVDIDVYYVVLSNTVTQYELTAPSVEGFSFLYWIDADSLDIISFDDFYSFQATASRSIEAIYEEDTNVEPTLFYETQFEGASKAAYLGAELTLSDYVWFFEDALIGTLSTDLDVDGNSVRIRDGYIQTLFTASDLSQVIFYAGTYGSDSATTVHFQISVDGETWVTVDSFTSTLTMDEYSYIFDDELFTSLSLDPDDDYYFKIVSETESRTNIDSFQIYTGEGQFVSDDSLYSISFTEDMVYQYLLNETVDLSGCIAIHEVTGNTTCDIIGSVDSSIPGVYDLIYYKTDEYNNTVSTTVTITIFNDFSAYLSLDLSTYFDDAEGLYGDDLINALHTIVNTGFVGVTYGEARYILDETDQDPNNSNNLILIYLANSISNIWDFGVTWNREHIWPQSLLGESADNSVVNSASDLYNLMPADPSENSSRGNSAYSELGLGYEPRDEVKGDVARALFYMMIMYDELELVNTFPGIYEMGYLDELIAWHYADPVDAFELNRQEIIYSYQLNRNPFVDYSHFVELIWFYN